jgi:membrane-bound lytic murein transglycosylase C
MEIDKQIPDKVARSRLQKTVQAAMQQGADQRPMIEIARRPVSKPAGEPILRNLIAGADGKSLNTLGYDKFSAALAAKARRESLRGDDGKQRFVYRAQFRLVSDHIKQRAQRYRKQVDNHAETHEIPSAVVMAVMETESMFNPTARSAAPAFGLMQLVPTSGARDAYRYLYKQDRIVTDTYLYDPDNNIQLGTAYLNRLYHGYLAGISKPEARLWASIAAYNTGPGNVFRTFAGSYSKARFGSRSRWQQIALNEINKRSPEQVYAFLRAHLPYTETRDYVKKVRERIPKYQAS